ncbi:MAG TPA: hypothetical protein VE861_01485 [Gemmatimonadaceae bacterium]|nr:hypothetical protein [Gemmatimonadaceae bacterium]
MSTPMRGAAVALLMLVGVSQAAAQARTSVPPRPNGPWPIKVREHIDLWLHGYALLSEDTSQVPLFRRGYRDSLIVVRNAAQRTSRLDSMRVALQRTLASTPELINGQFYASHFTNYGTLRVSLQQLTQSKGKVQDVRDRDQQQMVALAANYFGTAPTREFAEQFSVALESESQRFHHADWLETQRTRAPVITRADSLWRTVWFPKLAGFLRGTGQRNGEIIVSPVVEGEGRTITIDPVAGPSMVVTLPPSVDRTVEVLYGIVHEAVGAFAAGAVTENITPRQKSAGVADRLQTAAAVRAGALLLQRTLPAEVDGYARFYLRQLGKPVPATGTALAALEAAMPLQADILETMNKQMDLFLGGL